MARISNVTIPAEKQVATSLTYIYGIGPHHSAEILEKVGFKQTLCVPLTFGISSIYVGTKLV